MKNNLSRIIISIVVLAVTSFLYAELKQQPSQIIAFPLTTAFNSLIFSGITAFSVRIFRRNGKSFGSMWVRMIPVTIMVIGISRLFGAGYSHLAKKHISIEESVDTRFIPEIVQNEDPIFVPKSDKVDIQSKESGASSRRLNAAFDLQLTGLSIFPLGTQRLDVLKFLGSKFKEGQDFVSEEARIYQDGTSEVINDVVLHDEEFGYPWRVLYQFGIEGDRDRKFNHDQLYSIEYSLINEIALQDALNLFVQISERFSRGLRMEPVQLFSPRLSELIISEKGQWVSRSLVPYPPLVFNSPWITWALGRKVDLTEAYFHLDALYRGIAPGYYNDKEFMKQGFGDGSVDLTYRIGEISLANGYYYKDYYIRVELWSNEKDHRVTIVVEARGWRGFKGSSPILTIETPSD